MKFGKAVKLKVSACPNCGAVSNMASTVEGNGEPVEGDCTICIYCGHVNVFGEGLGLREPTPEEAVIFASDRRVQLVKFAIDSNNEKHNERGSTTH